MSTYPSQLLTLIAQLKKLPGVGSKTAERFAFYLLEWSKEDLKRFSLQIHDLRDVITPCEECGCLKNAEKCTFCANHRSDPLSLCLVSSPKDVYALEETRAFKGLYHVIGGLLSPLEGRSIDPSQIEKLEKRVVKHAIEEVVIAFDSTLEGDATALFLKEKLDRLGVKTTRLAFGLPMGSSLDFIDFGTLERAFTGRHTF